MKKLSKTRRMINRLVIGTTFLVLGIWISVEYVPTSDPMVFEEAIVFFFKNPIKNFFEGVMQLLGIVFCSVGLYIYLLPLIRKNFF